MGCCIILVEATCNFLVRECIFAQGFYVRGNGKDNKGFIKTNLLNRFQGESIVHQSVAQLRAV